MRRSEGKLWEGNLREVRGNKGGVVGEMRAGRGSEERKSRKYQGKLGEGK